MEPLTSSNDSHNSDYLNSSTFFVFAKRNVDSNNFKGGKIKNVFGETTLDFSKANIVGKITIDITQLFGEMTLIVPTTWRVETDLSQFLASSQVICPEPKLTENSEKILLVTGSSVFSSLNIVNAALMQSLNL
jgi:predicted membrane protein